MGGWSSTSQIFRDHIALRERLTKSQGEHVGWKSCLRRGSMDLLWKIPFFGYHFGVVIDRTEKKTNSILTLSTLRSSCSSTRKPFSRAWTKRQWKGDNYASWMDCPLLRTLPRRLITCKIVIMWSDPRLIHGYHPEQRIPNIDSQATLNNKRTGQKCACGTLIRSYRHFRATL